MNTSFRSNFASRSSRFRESWLEDMSSRTGSVNPSIRTDTERTDSKEGQSLTQDEKGGQWVVQAVTPTTSLKDLMEIKQVYAVWWEKGVEPWVIAKDVPEKTFTSALCIHWSNRLEIHLNHGTVVLQANSKTSCAWKYEQGSEKDDYRIVIEMKVNGKDEENPVITINRLIKGSQVSPDAPFAIEGRALQKHRLRVTYQNATTRRIHVYARGKTSAVNNDWTYAGPLAPSSAKPASLPSKSEAEPSTSGGTGNTEGQGNDGQQKGNQAEEQERKGWWKRWVLGRKRSEDEESL